MEQSPALIPFGKHVDKAIALLKSHISSTLFSKEKLATELKAYREFMKGKVGMREMKFLRAGAIADVVEAVRERGNLQSSLKYIRETQFPTDENVVYEFEFNPETGQIGDEANMWIKLKQKLGGSEPQKKMHIVALELDKWKRIVGVNFIDDNLARGDETVRADKGMDISQVRAMVAIDAYNEQLNAKDSKISWLQPKPTITSGARSNPQELQRSENFYEVASKYYKNRQK